eukprot:scaffold5944_cov133-Chaetoceros_neogracile.AAC.1
MATYSTQLVASYQLATIPADSCGEATDKARKRSKEKQKFYFSRPSNNYWNYENVRNRNSHQVKSQDITSVSCLVCFCSGPTYNKHRLNSIPYPPTPGESFKITIMYSKRPKDTTFC